MRAQPSELATTRVNRETVWVGVLDRQETQVKDLVILSSDSHTLDGCDRVMLDGDVVVVQGKPGNPGEYRGIRVPDGEVLSTVSVRVFLEAAYERERRLGQP
jgi:hypothetical protein